MTENQPKHMTGALLSGVIYLDGEGVVKEVHWCVTPDGETAPADVQPVIRRGFLDEASALLPAMLAELTERFARAAAVEAARAAKSKKKPTGATNSAVPQTGARVPEQPDENEEDPEPESEGDAEEHGEETGFDEPAREIGQEASSEDKLEGQSPVPTKPASQPERKISGKPDNAPAMASLFDGLDLS
jgi:hypothetical protein